ncbi:MAG: hypothetical protein O7C59_05805, partial [Rickettsia endosymbiont of Ixodes persulcatus]|nr:hypothetical protein [Rickettsia endosymbiont of Ixodes persulcatus]
LFLPTMSFKEIKALTPGDETPIDIQNSIGIYNNKAYVFGIFTSIDSFHFVNSKTKRYTPFVDDIVIGKVFYRCADYYKLDLKHCIGTLPSLAFKNATKRFKPELEINDYVLARITKVGSECLLSCVDQGMGKVEGYIMEVEQWKVRKLYLCSFLRDICKKHKFSCALGLNGRVWIYSEKLVTIRDIVHLLKSFT